MIMIRFIITLLKVFILQICNSTISSQYILHKNNVVTKHQVVEELMLSCFFFLFYYILTLPTVSSVYKSNVMVTIRVNILLMTRINNVTISKLKNLQNLHWTICNDDTHTKYWVLFTDFKKRGSFSGRLNIFCCCITL